VVLSFEHCLTQTIHDLSHLYSIFKVKTWQELANLSDNTAEITSLKFGPLGDYLVTGGLDRSIRVFGIAE
jgi:WD40 repeat protein